MQGGPAGLALLPGYLVSGGFAIPGLGGDAALTQDVLLRPSDQSSGQVVDELDVSGDCEERQVLHAIVHELLDGQGLIGTDDDAELDVVLAELARHRVRDHLHDGRMFEHGQLDFNGRDVLSATADRVFQSVDEVEVAVLVESAEVSGVHPHIPLYDRRGRGVREVTFEHHVRLQRPNYDLSDLAGRDFSFFLVEDLDLEVPDRLSGRTRYS